MIVLDLQGNRVAGIRALIACPTDCAE